MVKKKKDKTIKIYNQYIDDVLSNKFPTGRLVKLACKRHLEDLKTGKARGIYFDEDEADRVIRFFNLVRFYEGAFAGQRFVLQPWQAFIVASIFGWKNKDGSRRFLTAYVEVAKGSGKTPVAAVIGLYGLVADGEAGAEIYSAAVTREQAGITFRDAKNMAESSPSLAKRLLISANNIAYLAKQSFFRAVSSEHRGLDGKRPYIALIDEVHEHQTGMVIDKMRAGTKGRRSPLIFEITNSGYDKNSVCWHHHDYSQKILEGIIDNDSWFAYVCVLDVCQKCADEGKTMITDDCPDCDDWRDKKVWLKANPNLGISIKEKYLEQQVQEAIDMPSKQNIVKRLNFCIWSESETRWIGSDKWDACASAYTGESLKGKACCGGLDLSSIGDLTAFALIFPPMLEGEKYRILCRFWLPEEKILERSRKDKIPYDMWVRQGHIMVTPGNAIDYAFVIKTIQDDAKKFELGSIAFDRWGSTKIIQDLHNLGFEDPSETKNATRTLIDFGQGFASMSSPTKELEKMILKKEIEHPNNPVLNWMLSNTIITYDPAGNIKVDKSRSTEKVDGVIAVIMGLDLALRNQTEGEPSITIL